MTRAHHRPGWGNCGCQRPTDHEPGCRWSLDPERRVRLSAAIVVDGIPAPRMSPEDENQLIVRVRSDRAYARRVLAWFERRAAA